MTEEKQIIAATATVHESIRRRAIAKARPVLGGDGLGPQGKDWLTGGFRPFRLVALAALPIQAQHHSAFPLPRDGRCAPQPVTEYFLILNEPFNVYRAAVAINFGLRCSNGRMKLPRFDA